MNFLDKVKQGFDKAKDEVSDFAETAALKHEVSKLNDHKNLLFQEIGQQVYALHGKGQVIAEVEAQCRELQAMDEQIKAKNEEIARVAAA